ncbi:hypothetical protein LNP17_18250 [Klebsiella variicola subsp. variicola]|nr:hypothetical protein [Klebsiella variicola subsp. variicola]
MTAAPMAMPINAVCSSLSFMVSLRLSSRERLAKDTTSSISNSSSLHLPENAGAALTSPSPLVAMAQSAVASYRVFILPASRCAEINKNNARAEE